MTVTPTTEGVEFRGLDEAATATTTDAFAIIVVVDVRPLDVPVIRGVMPLG